MSESELLRDRLRTHLAKQRDLMSGQMKDPRRFHYQGISDFILREGQFFEPRPLLNGLDYMEIKHCYKNAFWTALQEGFSYVEGYAIGSSLGLPMLHAWNLDSEDFVVDRTWDPHGRVYFGVVFPLSVVPRKRRTQYAVLDDWAHGYPILRKAWDREATTKEALDELRSLRATE